MHMESGVRGVHGIKIGTAAGGQPQSRHAPRSHPQQGSPSGACLALQAQAQAQAALAVAPMQLHAPQVGGQGQVPAAMEHGHVSQAMLPASHPKNMLACRYICCRKRTLEARLAFACTLDVRLAVDACRNCRNQANNDANFQNINSTLNE